MGRSVMTHSDSVETFYMHLEFEDPSDAQYEWDCFIEDLQGLLEDRYPSMSPCDTWAHRECHGIMGNSLATVFVSEYCGLVAIDLVPATEYGDPLPLALGWCERAAKGFREMLTKAFPESSLTPMGRFSNGEQVFRKVA